MSEILSKMYGGYSWQTSIINESPQTDCSKNTLIANFMKIPPLGPEFSMWTEGWTDGNT